MSTDAPWHSLAPQEAAARLAVDPALGLPPAEVAARRAAHGPNSLPQVPPPSLWSLLWRQLRSPIVLILVVTAAVSLLMREVADALAILVALLLNVAVGGAWPGSPDGGTPLPQRMLVDYVRVYQR